FWLQADSSACTYTLRHDGMGVLPRGFYDGPFLVSKLNVSAVTTVPSIAANGQLQCGSGAKLGFANQVHIGDATSAAYALGKNAVTVAPSRLDAAGIVDDDGTSVAACSSGAPEYASNADKRCVSSRAEAPLAAASAHTLGQNAMRMVTVGQQGTGLINAHRPSVSSGTTPATDGQVCNHEFQFGLVTCGTCRTSTASDTLCEEGSRLRAESLYLARMIDLDLASAAAAPAPAPQGKLHLKGKVGPRWRF